MNWPDDYLIPGIEPYHVEEAGIIYCGDCRDILPEVPGSDCIITSPPYDQQRNYEGNMGDWNELMSSSFGKIKYIETTQILVNLGQIHKNGTRVSVCLEIGMEDLHHPMNISYILIKKLSKLING